MDVKIRNFQEGDEENLKQIWLEFIQDEEGSDLNIVPSKENADRWMEFAKNLIDKKKGALKVALFNNSIVGYILYAWNISPLETKMKNSIIYDLYVVPKFRRKGIGTQLLNDALNDLKEKGVDFVQLNVMSKNTPAINLYNKMGFVETMKVMRFFFIQNKYTVHLHS